MTTTQKHRGKSHPKPPVLDPENGGLVPRNVTINGQRTSVRLEAGNWIALYEIADREGKTVNQLCSDAVAGKKADSSATSAIRCFILAYFRSAATEDGHRYAGHSVTPPAPSGVDPEFPNSSA